MTLSEEHSSAINFPVTLAASNVSLYFSGRGGNLSLRHGFPQTCALDKDPPLSAVSSFWFELIKRPCGIREMLSVCFQKERKKVWYFDFIDLIKQTISRS